MRTWPGYFSWPPVLDHGNAVACSLIHGLAIFFVFALLALDNRIRSIFLDQMGKKKEKQNSSSLLRPAELPVQGSFPTEFMHYYMHPFGVRIGPGAYI